MLKIENAEVVGWKHAIRGMRNPMNSWEKSDSRIVYCDDDCSSCDEYKLVSDDYCMLPLGENIVIGPNDRKLMTKLAKAGTDHRKFMRMITVYLDITAPLYWWKEFDTYKVGTVANSCSTMHKIAEKKFTREDFSCEHLLNSYSGPEHNCWIEYGPEVLEPVDVLDAIIDMLNNARKLYVEYQEKAKAGDQYAKEHVKDYWWQMIQLLPSSYNQKRTVMLNYEVLANIYKSRRNHKLDEWHTLCNWIETLPYSELITGKEDGSK